MPEAEALLVGDNGQRVASLASLQEHLNLTSGGTASSSCAWLSAFAEGPVRKSGTPWLVEGDLLDVMDPDGFSSLPHLWLPVGPVKSK